jgi:hypothetical protein
MKMPKRQSQRYYVSTQALAGLAHDGIGWGHDQVSGSFMTERQPPKTGLTARVLRKFKKDAGQW